MHWLQHLFSWVRHRLFTAEMVRFIVVGIVATAIHYGVYYLLLGPVGHNIAYTVGYAVSFVANFMLSSLFTFRVRPSVQRFAGFGLSHLLNYVIQIVLLNVFILVGIPSSPNRLLISCTGKRSRSRQAAGYSVWSICRASTTSVPILQNSASAS